MVFDKKYVYYFNDFYIWFGECNGKTYFEISNKQFQECDLRRISLNNAGYYDEFTYIWFGKGIYKIDEINSTATQVIDNIYNVYFLEESIMAMKINNDRLDEMIQIIPCEDSIITLGKMQKENILR